MLVMQGKCLLVFPAGAGVILTLLMSGLPIVCVSRRRGGDPTRCQAKNQSNQCFPQARG